MPFLITLFADFRSQTVSPNVKDDGTKTSCNYRRRRRRQYVLVSQPVDLVGHADISDSGKIPEHFI